MQRILQNWFFKWVFMPITVILVIAVAALYYQYNRDPLVAGIPPHDNADGTVSYTLLAEVVAKTPTKSGLQLREWVVKLPKNARVMAVGEENVELNGQPFYRSRKNSSVSFTLDSETMKIAEAGNEIFKSKSLSKTGYLQILIDAGEFLPHRAGGPKTVMSDCHSTGKMIGLLEEFDNGPSQSGFCELGEFGYVLWTDASKKELTAWLRCGDGPEGSHDCLMYFVFHNQRFSGRIGREKYIELPNIVQRLTTLLDAATLIDHNYTGTPFVNSQGKIPE
jgi:hypothetical protein